MEGNEERRSVQLACSISNKGIERVQTVTGPASPERHAHLTKAHQTAAAHFCIVSIRDVGERENQIL